MHLSVEASLKKLRTSYIDILYVHWWDYTTQVEEVVNALHNLVVQGKVIYLVRFLSALKLRLPGVHTWRVGSLRYPGLDRLEGEQRCPSDG